MSIEAIEPPEPLRSVRGFGSAREFYQVLRTPAPLAGMPFPRAVPWGAVAAAGFDSIVCLTGRTPSYVPSPLRVLRAVAFKDLYGGVDPDDPEREAAMLSEVVDATVAEVRAARGVVVHCAGGTGRTGTVIACVLAALGMAEDEVLRYMTTVNAARGKSPGWPESGWQRRQVARFVTNNA